MAGERLRLEQHRPYQHGDAGETAAETQQVGPPRPLAQERPGQRDGPERRAVAQDRGAAGRQQRQAEIGQREVGGELQAAESGRVLWTDPLVWVDAMDAPRRVEPLPLVLFPDGCIYREQALKLLRRPWRIVYTSNSLTAVQAAVAAGLGLSVLARSALAPGIKAAAGLPRLPASEIALHRAPRLSAAAAALARDIEARFAA
jgi:DNA-binding transcriptional LysR family regulator